MLNRLIFSLVLLLTSLSSFALTLHELEHELESNTALKAALNISSKAEVVSISPLDGGLSGDAVYLISLPSSEQYVIKTFSEEKERRYSEIKHQKLAGEKDLGAKVLYVNSDETLVLMNYIPKKLLSEKNKSEGLATFLRQLHQVNHESVNKKVNPYPLLKSNRIAIKQAIVSHPIDKRILPVLEQVLQFERQPVLSLQPTFSHNDLNPGNVFYHQNHVLAIDWASSGLNDPFYDVATVANWFFLDRDQQLVFFERYLEHAPDKKEIAHFRHMQSVAKCVTGSFLMADAIRMGLPETLPQIENLPTLPEFLQQIGKGEVQLNSSLNLYTFGLLLIYDAGQ